MTNDSVARYARAAGILLLVSLVAGGFGELYVPAKLIVSADASATAANIGASVSLFRLGFAGYLVEALCDVTLTLIFYVLLRPVSNNLALLAAFFGLVGTVVFCVAELFYFTATLVLGGADYLKTFTPAQLNTLALLSLKVYSVAGGILMAFGGVGGIITGYLIYRSGYLPRFMGVLFALGGLGFVIRNFALVLAPAYALDWLLLPTNLAALVLALWLLIRGINLPRWEEMAARPAA